MKAVQQSVNKQRLRQPIPGEQKKNLRMAVQIQQQKTSLPVSNQHSRSFY